MSSTATHSRRSPRPSAGYLRLIRQFPLRPIQSESELRQATAILDRLFGTTATDPGEDDYVHVLASLVEEYESEHTNVPDNASGLDVLRHLVEEHEIKQSDLARILGVGPSAVSMILGGDRPITADHARRLGKRFGMDAGTFL